MKGRQRVAVVRLIGPPRLLLLHHCRGPVQDDSEHGDWFVHGDVRAPNIKHVLRKDKSFKARAESTTGSSWGRRIRKIMFESRLVSYVEPIVVGRRRALPHLFGQAD
jgi:hypothetical protein